MAVRIPAPWRKLPLALLALLVCEVGARVALPGVDARALGEYFRTAPGSLLALYDWIGGGGLSRGAVLALGVMPWLSATLLVRLARSLVPSLGAGRATLTRWSRALTVGLALVQSYGFAHFAQSVPGAVAEPGAGFVVRTMLVLTLGAVLVMLLGERVTARDDDDAADDAAERGALGDGGERLLRSGQYPGADGRRERAGVGVGRG
jgi:preprotein translocase subunit SecY